VLHDTPSPGGGRVTDLLLKIRRHFARRVTLCVLPQDERARFFRRQTGADRVVVAYKCPLRRDLRPAPRKRSDGSFVLWYHASLGPKRLPEGFVSVPSLFLITMA
jgi:hypothetical protein